ncbi:hypothetical protein J6590_019912 [Homalodisca vitripennis]|nr:hypothetical protein J6590_019912 [Homalodisca vitripennis]
MHASWLGAEHICVSRSSGVVIGGTQSNRLPPLPGPRPRLALRDTSSSHLSYPITEHMYNLSRTIRATDCRHSSVPGLGSHCVTPRPHTCPTQLLNTCCTIAHIQLEQQIAATPRSPASARTA